MRLTFIIRRTSSYVSIRLNTLYHQITDLIGGMVFEHENGKLFIKNRNIIRYRNSS